MSDAGYYGLYHSFTSRSNYREKYIESLEAISADQSHLKLDKVKSCLTLGAGAGLNELGFIKRLMPNLKSLTAVDPDKPSVEQMRLNMKNILPDVNADVREMTAEDFIFNGEHKKDEVYDVILAFRMVYFFEKEARPNIYRKLSADFLSEDGMIVVNWFSHSDHPEYVCNLATQIGSKHHMPTVHDITNDFLEAGFHMDKQYEFQYTLDASSLDDGILKWIAMSFGSEVSMEELRALIQKVWPNCKSDNQFGSFLVFKK